MLASLFGSYLYLILATSIALYLILDGFHTGIGCLYLFLSPKEQTRARGRLNSIWDMNALWLVITMGVLFVGFPLCYSTILQNLYVPIFCIIFAIIARTASLEFCNMQDAAFWKYCLSVSNIFLASSLGVVAALILGHNTILFALFFPLLFSFHAALFLNLKNGTHIHLSYLAVLLGALFVATVFASGHYYEFLGLIPIVLSVMYKKHKTFAFCCSGLFIIVLVASWTVHLAPQSIEPSRVCSESLVLVIGIGVPLFAATMAGVYWTILNKKE